MKEAVEKILDLIKSVGVKKKARGKDADIVGIWQDTFDDQIPSQEIQTQMREKNWERF